MTTATDFFGFLPEHFSAAFDSYKIMPLKDFEDTKKQIEEFTHPDGFYYPPPSCTMTYDPVTSKMIRKVPRTERHAFLYRLPPSHEISFESGNESKEESRGGILGFLIYLLAYLFGRRFQFYDWWFDGKIPMKSHHNVIITRKAAEEFLSVALEQWKGWSDDQRVLFKNILYMHSRSPSYEWYWERFMTEYTVFDGCWRFKFGKKSKYLDRMEGLLKACKMVIHKEKMKDIVDLRNDLFHEALWGKGQPCTGVSTDAFMSWYDLRRINQRLFPALLGFETKYISTDWCYMGTLMFKDSTPRAVVPFKCA